MSRHHGATVAGLACLAAALAGFGWFLRLVDRRDAAPPPACRAIVALTGGAGRIEAALRLFAARPGASLLISGVPANVSLDTLARRAQLDPADRAGAIRLGHAATTTRGNVAEIAAWLGAAGASGHDTCLTVVTSDYHMPRALLELRRALPGIDLVAAPSGAPETHRWRRLLGEYGKFLIAAAGLSFLEPERAGRP